MIYTYKCESCSSIGELEELIPSVQCPACGGEMRPMDGQGNISQPSSSPSSTNSGPVKVAKTVNFGFSGMLKGSGTGTGAFMPSRSSDTSESKAPRTLPGSTGTDHKTTQQAFDPNKTNYPAPSVSQQQQNKSPKKTFSISKATVKRPPDVQQKSATEQSNTQPPAAPPKPQSSPPAPTQTQMSLKKTQPNNATSIKFKIKSSGTSTQIKSNVPPSTPPPQQQQQTSQVMPPQQQQTPQVTPPQQRQTPPPHHPPQAMPPQALPPPAQHQTSGQKTVYQRTELEMAPPTVQNMEYQKQILDSFNTNEALKFEEIQKKPNEDQTRPASAQSIPNQQRQPAVQPPPPPSPSEEAIEERIRIQSEKIAEERIRRASLEMETRFRNQQEVDAKKATEEMGRRLREERERFAKSAEEEKLKLITMVEEEKARSRKLADEAAKKAAMQTFEMLTIKMEKEKEELRHIAEEKARREREVLEKRIKELEDNKWEKDTLDDAVSKALEVTSTNIPPVKSETSVPVLPNLQEIEQKPKDAEPKEKDGISKKKMPEQIKKDQTEDNKTMAKDEATSVKPEEKKSESTQKSEEKKEDTEKPKPDADKEKDKKMNKDGLPPPYPKKKPGTNMGTTVGMKKNVISKNSTTATSIKKTESGKDESREDENGKKAGAGTNGDKNGKPTKTQTGMAPIHGITHTGLLKLQDKKTKTIIFMIISSFSLFAILLFIVVLTLKSCAAKKQSSAPKPTPSANTASPFVSPPSTTVSKATRNEDKEPSSSKPITPVKESPLKGNYLALRGKINKNPASKEEINNNIKILQGFLDTYSPSNPDDEWVKTAKEQIKAQEDLKVWYQ